jgi:hypothetical protein
LLIFPGFQFVCNRLTDAERNDQAPVLNYYKGLTSGYFFEHCHKPRRRALAMCLHHRSTGTGQVRLGDLGRDLIIGIANMTL